MRRESGVGLQAPTTFAAFWGEKEAINVIFGSTVDFLRLAVLVFEAGLKASGNWHCNCRDSKAPLLKGLSLPTLDNSPPETTPAIAPPATQPAPSVVTISTGDPVPAAHGADAATGGPPAAVASTANAQVKAVAVKGADEVLKAECDTPAAVQALAAQPPASILTIDIGGTKVKILATGQTEPRKATSGKDFTPAKLVDTVRSLARDWDYEAVTIGYPGLVGPHGPRSEPGNLGAGWVGFDFATAFGKPVKMFNDAAMQALGSYEGGRMLFLGLGTGLGSALITGHVVVPLELGRLPFDGERTFGEVLGRRGLARIGKGEWRKAVARAVTSLMGAFVVDYVVIGGGNAKNVKDLPPGSRLGHNLTAFRGGFRLWSAEDVWVLAAPGGESPHPTAQEALRVL
jgi:polyphosphate glucokinase